MILGLLGAFGSALCYGIASTLQALAARRAAVVEGLDPRLLLRLARWRASGTASSRSPPVPCRLP